MIGYILLITFALVLAGIVYAWLKSYVPKGDIECPEGVSVYLSNYGIDQPSLGMLNLTFKNNGVFSIDGIYIFYADNATEEIATEDLSGKFASGDAFLDGGGLKFNSPLVPDKVISLIFDVSAITAEKVDVVPFREQQENNKIKTVTCGNSKISKTII